tara:strand:- start:429 stop:767 length:339 start_codon:yes stop_codon:yes gene_type:complete
MRKLNEFLDNNPNTVGYRFVIYGHPTEEEIGLLSKGLYFQLESHDVDVFLMIEVIDEKAAKAFDSYQGTFLSFVLGSRDNYEEMIRDIILGGIQFLRYKGEYLGKKERNINV